MHIRSLWGQRQALTAGVHYKKELSQLSTHSVSPTFWCLPIFNIHSLAPRNLNWFMTVTNRAQRKWYPVSFEPRSKKMLQLPLRTHRLERSTILHEYLDDLEAAMMWESPSYLSGESRGRNRKVSLQMFCVSQPGPVLQRAPQCAMQSRAQLVWSQMLYDCKLWNTKQEPVSVEYQVKSTELWEITNDHLNHSFGVVYCAVLDIRTGVMLDVAGKKSPRVWR